MRKTIAVSLLGMTGAATCCALERGLRDLGASGGEARERLPGDHLVPAPVHSATQAISVDASPAGVWPWLVQMGCGRAGWYAIDRFDNAGRPSASAVHPEWQQLAVGDLVDAVPGGRIGFPVEILEPERALVFGGPVRGATREPVRAPGARGEFSWAFVLRDAPGGATRLLVRARRSAGGPLYEAPARLLWTLGHVPMQQVQLRRLRARALSAGPSSPP